MIHRHLFAAMLLVVADPLAAQTAGPVPTRQLTDGIRAADVALFSAFFDRCDVATLATLVSDDFEMFHDKGGRTASKAEFIKGIEATCARQKTGEDYRARRELVAASLKVYPLNDYGSTASTSYCRGGRRSSWRSRCSRMSGGKTRTAGSSRAQSATTIV
jgi:hypothetical protein